MLNTKEKFFAALPLFGLINVNLASPALANELVHFDDFNDLISWSAVEHGVIEISPASTLRFFDDTDSNNALFRNDIDVPDRYILSLDATINQYSAASKDALGVRLRDGDHKLELKFRDGGLFVLKDNGSGGQALQSILGSVDTANHTYRIEVEDGSAEIYQDGTSIYVFDMPSDLGADTIYFYNRGTLANPSEASISSFNLIDMQTALFSKPDYFSVFDALPGSTASTGGGTFSIEDTYSPSDTAWTADNLDPLNVWQKTLKHDNNNASRDWEIRIGRGGQIYSFRTRAGELVPPQEHKGAEWIDEVFQVVTANTLINNRDFIAYPSRSFAHQAGVYWLKKAQGVEEDLDPLYLDKSVYSPMLAAHENISEKSYSTLVWPQYSHVPSIYESEQLIYTKYRDMGDGVIEFTYVVTNNGEDKLNWVNVPWGGVRMSSLRQQIMSNPDGTYSEHDRRFGKQSDPAESDDMGLFNHEDTGGWFAWSDGTAGASDALGVVFGTDDEFDTSGPDYHWNRSHFKWGWTPGTRDYNVGVNIVPANIEPGETFYYRGYMIVGTLSHVQTKGNALKDDVQYGILDLDETQAATYDLVEAAITRDNVSQTILSEANGTRDLAVFTDPVTNSVPVFLMEDTSNNTLFISDNPRELSTITSYTNPYQSYLEEDWTSLSNWIVNENSGTIQISPNSQLHLEETASGTTNSVHRNDINIPSTYRLRFRAKIDSFANAPATPLGVRVRNGEAKLELIFRNGDLLIRDGDGAGLSILKENIATGQWHTYEFAVKYNGLSERHRTEFYFDGEPAMNTDGGVNAIAGFGLPVDTGVDQVYFWVKSPNIKAESYMDWLQIEDVFFDQLSNRDQNRPYDGHTKYRGFLGYAMPEGHTSTAITYQSLNGVVSDTSYYPNPGNQNLLVID